MQSPPSRRDSSHLSLSEQTANVLGSFAITRRPDPEKAETLPEQDLKELRHSHAHLSVTAVRDFYEQADQDCRWSTAVFRTPERCRPSCRRGSSCRSGTDRRQRSRWILLLPFAVTWPSVPRSSPSLKHCLTPIAAARFRLCALHLMSTTRGMGISCREATRRFEGIGRGTGAWRRSTRKADDAFRAVTRDAGWSLIPAQVLMPYP